LSKAMAKEYNLKIVLKLFLSKETCQVNIFSNENRQYDDKFWTRAKSVCSYWIVRTLP